MVHSFSGTKRVSHPNEEHGMGATLGKFDSSDSNERLWQTFTNAKIREKMLFRVVEENFKCL